MRSTFLEPSEVLSFRHTLVGALRDFLKHEDLAFEDTAEAMGEVLVALSRYQEEGAPLYPSLFLCDDLRAMLTRLGGRDHLFIGSGPREPSTMRRALKQCAQLGRSGWAIYVVRRPTTFEYGIFRTDSFYLEQTPMARLRELVDASVKIVGVVQLGENILELRGSGGTRRLIYLSGAPTDALPAIAVIRDLAAAIARDVPPEQVPRVRTFLMRVFIDAMRSSHGSLVAVLPHGTTPNDIFPDAIVLERPIRLPTLIAQYERARTEEARESVQGAGRLLEGMLGVDGITVLTSDGSLVAYNAFLYFSPVPTRENDSILGGARRRTYDALATMVGHRLVATFMRSQDGFAHCSVAPDDAPVWRR